MKSDQLLTVNPKTIFREEYIEFKRSDPNVPDWVPAGQIAFGYSTAPTYTITNSDTVSTFAGGSYGVIVSTAPEGTIWANTDNNNVYVSTSSNWAPIYTYADDTSQGSFNLEYIAD